MRLLGSECTLLHCSAAVQSCPAENYYLPLPCMAARCCRSPIYLHIARASYFSRSSRLLFFPLYLVSLSPFARERGSHTKSSSSSPSSPKQFAIASARAHVKRIEATFCQLRFSLYRSLPLSPTLLLFRVRMGVL